MPAITVLLLLGIACNKQESAPNEKRIKTDTVIIPPKKETVIDTVYVSDQVWIYADTTIDKSKIMYSRSRFRPYMRFDDFKVKVDNTKKAKLDLNSHKYGRMFRTNLRNEFARDSANFAVHYSLVTCGCGSPCQMSLLIDRYTGKIYDAPNSIVGVDFRANSRMLIVNPPDEDGFYRDDIGVIPEIHILTKRQKIFEKRYP